MDSVIDLPQIAKAAGHQGSVTVATFEPTAEQIRRLRSVTGRPILSWRGLLGRLVFPAYAEELALERAAGTDPAAADRLSDKIERAARESETAVATAGAQVGTVIAAVSAWHASKLVGNISRAINRDLRGLVEQFRSEAVVRSAVRRNVALIRGLDADLRRQIERSVLDAWDGRKSVKRMKIDVRNATKFAPARANLIARDQIHKLMGEMDRHSALRAGVKEFVWEHSLLPNPREHHLDLHGRVFRWDRPPEGVIPGEEINCRCRAALHIEL